MGLYIETPNKKNKADQLLALYPEVRELKLPFFDVTGNNFTIVVVENGPFDAAAIAYDFDELRRVTEKTGRPVRYLYAPRELILRLVPIAKDFLAPITVITKPSKFDRFGPDFK